MKEKGHQVGFMGKIYRKAHRVLLYVGSDCGEDGERVSTLLRDVRRSIDDELTRLDTSIFDVYPYPAPDNPVLTDLRWTAINRLVRQEWFVRGWVIREAGLAQSDLLIWGQSQYDWGDVMMVLMWAIYRAKAVTATDVADTPYLWAHTEAYRDQHIDSLRVFLNEEQAQPNRLLEYIYYDMSFTDPRDRIYAFLDLTTEPSNGLDLRPNYDLSIEEVFHDFAKQYIRATGDMRLLDYITHRADTLQAGLPSWVPNWGPLESQHIQHVQQITFGCTIEGVLCPRQGTFRRAELVNEATLMVHGVVFDSVRFLSEIFQPSTTTPDIVLNLWNYIRHTDGPSPYPIAHRMEAFLNTLTRNTHVGNQETWRMCGSMYLQRLYEHSSQPLFFERGLDDQYADRLAFMDRNISVRTTATRFMITKRGYMGLAPAVAQEDDLCSIIFGCEYPSLLRATKHASRYQFLGPAYVLGSLFRKDEDFHQSNSYDDDSRESGSHGIHTEVTAMGVSDTENKEDLSYSCIWNNFGDEYDKAWIDWAEEQDIYLC